MSYHQRTTRAIMVAATSLWLVAGCGGSNGEEQITISPPEVYRIEMSSGNEQIAQVGTTLPDPVVVAGPPDLINPDAVHRYRVTIVWTVTSGGGSVAEATTQIDALAEEPRSGNVWTLGPEPGTQTLRVQIADGASTVTFTATATD